MKISEDPQFLYMELLQVWRIKLKSVRSYKSLFLSGAWEEHFNKSLQEKEDCMSVITMTFSIFCFMVSHVFYQVNLNSSPSRSNLIYMSGKYQVSFQSVFIDVCVYLIALYLRCVPNKCKNFSNIISLKYIINIMLNM